MNTAPTEIYTLSLHDALPISKFRELVVISHVVRIRSWATQDPSRFPLPTGHPEAIRSEEHTSELQSRLHLVCRLLLEKKKKTATNPQQTPSHNHGDSLSTHHI